MRPPKPLHTRGPIPRDDRILRHCAANALLGVLAKNTPEQPVRVTLQNGAAQCGLYLEAGRYAGVGIRTQGGDQPGGAIDNSSYFRTCRNSSSSSRPC
jgi:hypothetical protein